MTPAWIALKLPVPIGLSPPGVLVLPPWPTLTSLQSLPFPWEQSKGERFREWTGHGARADWVH